MIFWIHLLRKLLKDMSARQVSKARKREPETMGVKHRESGGRWVSKILDNS